MVNTLGDRVRNASVTAGYEGAQEVTAEFFQNALRSAGMATYLSTMDEYKDLMTTLQKALSEGFALTKTEQERLAGLKERARIMVDFQIDPEDRAKEEIAQATVDRYNQQKRLGATERALSVLGAK